MSLNEEMRVQQSTRCQKLGAVGTCQDYQSHSPLLRTRRHLRMRHHLPSVKDNLPQARRGDAHSAAYALMARADRSCGRRRPNYSSPAA